MIITCNCASEFQDKEYGKNKRVANLKKDVTKCKCTVCGKEHQVSNAVLNK